jgi:hypothetical protein
MRLSRSLPVLVLASIAGFSCGSGSPNDGGRGDASEGGYGTAETYTRPPVPAGATLLETPEFTVPASSEILYCTVTTITLDRAIDTRELHSYQLRGGHHAVLFYFERHHDPAPPHECTEEEMSDLRFIGGGEESSEQALNLPPGIGVRIPAGAQLVMQSHYLNTDARDRTVRDALTIVPAAPGTITTLADPMAINDGDPPAGRVRPHARLPHRRRHDALVDARSHARLGHAVSHRAHPRGGLGADAHALRRSGGAAAAHEPAHSLFQRRRRAPTAPG